MSLCIFVVILKVLLLVASSIQLLVLFFSKCSPMLIRPLVLIVLSLVITCSLTLPLSLGEPRNNPWFLDPPLRSSIGAWLLLLASFSCISISFKNFLFHSSFFSLYGVIIRLPSTLSRIPSFTNEPDIWTSIVIWFVINLKLVCLGPALFLLLLNWPIFLRSPSPQSSSFDQLVSKLGLVDIPSLTLT